MPYATVGTRVALFGTRIAYLRTPAGSQSGDTFSRGDGATCATQFNVSGRYELAAANVLRTRHYIGGVRTMVLESARLGAYYGSCSWADSTYWNASADFTLTPATSLFAGQTAQTHVFVAGAPGRQTIGGGNGGTFVQNQTDCLVLIIERGNASVCATGIYDNTQAAFPALAQYNWNTGTFSSLIGSTAGYSVIALGTGPNGGTLIAIVQKATGTASGTGGVGHTRTAFVYPASNSPSAGDSATIHYCQVQPNTTYAKLPIVTAGAAAASQAADALRIAGVQTRGQATLFTRYYDLATSAWVNAVQPYVSRAAIVPAVDRAYSHLAVLQGRFTASQGASLLRI